MKDKKRVFTILSVDGGGCRGVVAARILQEIEERTGKPISSLFDIISGASTGSIIVGGLVIPDADNQQQPRFTAKDMKEFYFKYAGKIFPEMKFKDIRKISHGTLYDPKPYEDVLLNNFGDAKLKDSLTHVMIPATDIKNFRPVWMSHFKGQKDLSEEGWSTMLMRDAVRASTTAPTFFPAKYYTTTPNEDIPHITHRHALIDGDFFASTALHRLMVQGKRLAPPDAEIVVVHVGTGKIENHLSPEEFNQLGILGLISKAKGSVLLSLVTAISNMDVLENMKDSLGDHFISFEGFINQDEADAPSSSLDDGSTENLKRLERFAEKIIHQSNHEMDRLVEILNTRSFAEQTHEVSKNALQSITETLAEKKTVRSLTRVYSKIVRFSTDLDYHGEPGDEKLKQMCDNLTEHHKNELDRIYHVLLDRRKTQSQLLGTVRELGSEITAKISEPFRKAPEQNNNPASKKQPPSPPAA